MHRLQAPQRVDSQGTLLRSFTPQAVCSRQLTAMCGYRESLRSVVPDVAERHAAVSASIGHRLKATRLQPTLGAAYQGGNL